jgi:hypothetical protein
MKPVTERTNEYGCDELTCSSGPPFGPEAFDFLEPTIKNVRGNG